MIKYLFVLAFIVVYISFDNEIGYSATSPLYTHFTYMFQHASIAHLIMNSIVFIGIFTGLSRYVRKVVVVSIMIASAVGTSFFSEYAIPTVGASSMIYAMVGGYISTTLIRRDIKIASIKKYLLFIFCIVIGMFVSLIRPGNNFFAHLYSLAFGFALFATVALHPIMPASNRSTP